jgi:hypothetical protein
MLRWNGQRLGSLWRPWISTLSAILSAARVALVNTGQRRGLEGLAGVCTRHVAVLGLSSGFLVKNALKGYGETGLQGPCRVSAAPALRVWNCVKPFRNCVRAHSRIQIGYTNWWL